MAVDVGKAVGYLDLDTTGWNKGFKTAFENMASFKDETQSFSNKMETIGSTMTSTGKSMTLGLTVPLVGLGAGFVATTAKFESGMKEVQAISGATSNDLKLLSDKAKEMGATTKFSASESAEALKYMSMAGWETKAMLDALPGVMNLAAASGEELGTVSDIVTDSMTAFGLAANEAGRFADVLAKASSKSNTNVGLMGETFKYVAPVAGALGYSIEDTALAVGLMANAGIKGSQAGTALRQMFAEMTGPMKLVGDTFGELDIAVENQDGSMRDLKDIIGDLRELWPYLTETEQAHNAELNVGKNAMSGFLAIMNATDADFEKLSNELMNSEGAAKEMADTMNDNLSGQITLLKSGVEGVAISFGELMLPAIKNINEFITKLVEKINNLSEEQKKTILTIATIVASIGPLLLIGGKLITGIIKINKIFKAASTIASVAGTTVGGLMSPILLIVGGVALLAAAWATNFGGIREKTKEIFENLTGLFTAGWELLKKIWNSNFLGIQDIVTIGFGFIEDVFSIGLDAINNIISIFTGILTGNWDKAFKGLKGLAKNGLDLVVSALKGFKNIFFGLGKKAVKWLWDGVKKAWGAFSSWVKDSWKSLFTFGEDGKDLPDNPSRNRSSGTPLRNGLSYIPYDGFDATLHEGERVLTKSENEEYNKKNEGKGDTYIFNSPKAITPAEARRQMKKAKKEILFV